MSANIQNENEFNLILKKIIFTSNEIEMEREKTFYMKKIKDKNEFIMTKEYQCQSKTEACFNIKLKLFK